MRLLRTLLIFIAIAVMGVALARCSKAPESPAPAATQSPPAQPLPPPTQSPPPPTQSSQSSPTAPAQPSSAPAASTPAPTSSSEASSADAAPLLSAALLEGRDYVSIPNGTPLKLQAGKVEVAELFNYACPACNTFEPKLVAWKKNLPDYAYMTYVALDFRPDFVPYARAYFAADTLGIAEKAHEAVYDAIHQLHTLPGEGKPADEEVIAKFYANYGADPVKFKELMDSFGVNAQIAAGRQFASRSKVTGTPSLVIDGKYLVKGETYDIVLQNATQLIAKAHAE